MADRVYRTGNGPTLGMRGTHTWTANEAPDKWRDMILWLYPNGSTPLTAMTAKLKNVPEDNPHYHWFTKTIPDKGLTVANVFTNTDLNAALPAGAFTEGTTVFVPLTAAFANQTRAGHEMLIRQTGNQAEDFVTRVVSVNRAGDTTSYAQCVTLNAGSISAAPNRILLIGNINPEASVRPAVITYNAREFDNQQQIFRTALGQSRTDMNRKTRIGDTYTDMKKECLEDHAIEMEWAFMFSEKSWRLGDNGMPERTTEGIIPFVKRNAAANVIDCARITELAGDAWADTGEEIFNHAIQTSFRWGKATEKTVLCGAGVLAAVNRMVMKNGNYQIEQGEGAYGIKVTTLQTVFGKWNFVHAPLWTHEASQTNCLLAFEPGQIEYRYALDTKFEKDIHYGNGGGDGLDGKKEGFITECGLALYHPELFTYMTNVGVDSVLSAPSP